MKAYNNNYEKNAIFIMFIFILPVQLDIIECIITHT